MYPSKSSHCECTCMHNSRTLKPVSPDTAIKSWIYVFIATNGTKQKDIMYNDIKQSTNSPHWRSWKQQIFCAFVITLLSMITNRNIYIVVLLWHSTDIVSFFSVCPCFLHFPECCSYLNFWLSSFKFVLCPEPKVQQMVKHWKLASDVLLTYALITEFLILVISVLIFVSYLYQL